MGLRECHSYSCVRRIRKQDQLQKPSSSLRAASLTCQWPQQVTLQSPNARDEELYSTHQQAQTKVVHDTVPEESIFRTDHSITSKESGRRGVGERGRAREGLAGGRKWGGKRRERNERRDAMGRVRTERVQAYRYTGSYLFFHYYLFCVQLTRV